MESKSMSFFEDFFFFFFDEVGESLNMLKGSSTGASKMSFVSKGLELSTSNEVLLGGAMLNVSKGFTAAGGVLMLDLEFREVFLFDRLFFFFFMLRLKLGTSSSSSLSEKSKSKSSSPPIF